MGLLKDLKNYSFWQSIDVIGLAVLQLTYLMSISRILSKDDFGLMAIASSLLAFGTMISEVAFGPSIIQKKGLNRKHIDAAYKASILLGILLSAIYFSLSGFLANLFDQPLLSSMLKIMSGSLILNAICAIGIALLHKDLDFKLSSQVNLIANGISYVLGIILAVNGLGVWSLIYAAIIKSVIKFGLLVKNIKFLGFQLNIKKELSELWYFSLGVMLIGFSNVLGASGLKLVLSKIMPISILGIYDRANSIQEMPANIIGRLIDSLLFPVLSNRIELKSKMMESFETAMGTVNFIVFPITLLLYYLSGNLVITVLGEGWQEAVMPFSIMILTLPLGLTGRLVDTVLRSKGLVYLILYRKLIYLVVLIVSSGYAAFYYGLLGVALAYLFSVCINYIMALGLMNRIFGMKGLGVFMQAFRESVVFGAAPGMFLFLITLFFEIYYEPLSLQFICLIFLLIYAILYTRQWKIIVSRRIFLIRLFIGTKS